MAFGRVYLQKRGSLYDSLCQSFPGNRENNYLYHQSSSYNCNYNYDYYNGYNYSHLPRDSSSVMRSHGNYQDVYRNYWEQNSSSSYSRPRDSSSFNTECTSSGRHSHQPYLNANSPTNCNSTSASTGPGMSKRAHTACKRGRSELENGNDAVLMSKEEIERCSPSRKDGIDALHETRLRYSYCAFIQNLGMCLELPQTTIGTAMVLCHRFFLRRSHACHDRFLIASAALFLAAKSEETAHPLNNVLRASCQIIYRQDLSVLSYMFPIGWYEQYRERVLEAEQLILTTLDFELEVQHPYDPLMSILSKLGLSQTILVNLALNLVSEGLRSSLWLQFKPQHIAAGAVYLAAKLLNMDVNSCQNIWREFQAPHKVLNDVAEQLKELF